MFSKIRLQKVSELSVSIRICDDAGVQTSLLSILFPCQTSCLRHQPETQEFLFLFPTRTHRMDQHAEPWHPGPLGPHWQDHLSMEFSFLLQRICPAPLFPSPSISQCLILVLMCNDSSISLITALASGQETT